MDPAGKGVWVFGVKAFVGASVVAITLATTLAGCAADGQEHAAVVVGSGDEVTSELLAHIYAGAVRSAGVAVTVKEGLGERADYLTALDAGEISLVPDFTGDLLHTFDSLSGATEAEDVFIDLNRSLPEGLSVGDYSLAEDRTTIAVSPTGPLSELSTISELASAHIDASVGVVGDPAKPDPQEVVFGLRSAADFSGAGSTDFVVYADAQGAVDALNSGEIGALAFTTASFGPLAADLTTLEDDDSVFTAQNVVPLMREGVLDDSAYATLSVVAGELTTADLADMIGEVRSGGASGDVAARWLGEHNL